MDACHNAEFNLQTGEWTELRRAEQILPTYPHWREAETGGNSRTKGQVMALLTGASDCDAALPVFSRSRSLSFS